MRIVKIILKNIIKGVYIIKLLNIVTLNFRGVIYEKIKINGMIYCISDKKGNIIIGDNCVINSSLASNPIGGATRTILFSRNNGIIKIGNNVGISNSALFSFERIEIGDNVLIGGNVKIYDSDFHAVQYWERGGENEKIKTKPVIIEDYVFVGGHSIILKGVTIGKGAVIGAGSVVTQDIPEMEIWAGNPAKYVKSIEDKRDI